MEYGIMCVFEQKSIDLYLLYAPDYFAIQVMMTMMMVDDADHPLALKKAGAAVPAAVVNKQDATAVAALSASAAAPPLVFGSGVDDNNKSWFQARSG